MRKTYQSLKYVDDSYCIIVNGNKMFVRFNGGSLQPRVNGKFTTTDPDVMIAMESCKGFNKEFRLVSADDAPVKTFPAAVVVPPPPPPPPDPDPDPDPEVGNNIPPSYPAPEDTGSNDPGPDYGDGESGDQKIEEVPGITTVQAAKQYLINNKGVQVSKLPNKAAVLEHAVLNNVKFIDLQ